MPAPWSAGRRLGWSAPPRGEGLGCSCNQAGAAAALGWCGTGVFRQTRDDYTECEQEMYARAVRKVAVFTAGFMPVSIYAFRVSACKIRARFVQSSDESYLNGIRTAPNATETQSH